MRTGSEEQGYAQWALRSLAGVIAALLVLAFLSQFRGWAGAFGVSGLIYLSAASVGALLGFVFAVPRVIARENSGAADGAGSKLLDTNTNLEKISDWLTTMLVGVGLSQLTNLGDIMFKFRVFLAETATVFDVGNATSAGMLPTIGPFILALGAASGFLFMYLQTRLVLVHVFMKSEQSLLSGTAAAAIRQAVAGAQADQESPPDETPPEGDPDAVPGPPSPPPPPAPAPAPAPTFALRRASQASTLSTDDALEVMFDLLYQPGGYRRVIQMAGELSRSPLTKRPEYWFYLAAAFGQDMHRTEEGSDDRRSARDNAIDAAGRAVSIDKSFRARLWAISNPNSTDNDLALLRNDPVFLKLVGKS